METIIESVLAIVVVVNIILSVIIFSRGRAIQDIYFALIAITCAIWGGAIIGFYSIDYQTSFNWILITHTAAVFISYFFLVFSVHFPKKILKNSLFAQICFLPVAVIIYLLFFTNFIVGGIDGYTYKINLGYVAYGLIVISYFFLGFYYLVQQYKKTLNTLEKKQVEYVLVGSFIASTLAIVPDLILPYLNIFNFTWLGPIFTLIMVVSLFLAMLRYHLFSIKVILTELVSVIIVVVLLIELFLAKSVSELVLKCSVLIIVTVFCYLLIKSVYAEVHNRERIELLATDLQKANNRLTELDRQKSEFVSFATHQLRAPLTAMKGYASLLLEGDMGDLPKEAKEGVSRIYDSTNTLVSIVNDYLNITRIELGTMKYAFETIDLKELINDVIAEIKPNIDKTGLQFTFSADDSCLDYRTTADRDKLKQVIANLIDNSIKYTPQGSVTVKLYLDRNNHKFVFSVRDTGVGIAPETLPHLFQKFSRAENANKTNIRGTGLGLYVAKQMVEAHHGTIKVESAGEGKGSTFLVELEPLAKA